MDTVRNISPTSVCAVRNPAKPLISGEFHCPNSWVIHADVCYYINETEQLNWHQARESCMQMNGTMAMITNDEQTTFMIGIRTTCLYNF